MPIAQNNSKKLRTILRRQLSRGVGSAVRWCAKEYKKKLSEKTHPEYPSGPFHPPHSAVGQYPDRETGQGVANVTSEVKQSGDNIAGGFGVRDDIGPYPPTHDEAGGRHVAVLLVKQGRKGPVQLFQENRQRVRAEFRKGAAK